jgi:hypothetical protein
MQRGFITVAAVALGCLALDARAETERLEDALIGRLTLDKGTPSRVGSVVWAPSSGATPKERSACAAPIVEAFLRVCG